MSYGVFNQDPELDEVLSNFLYIGNLIAAKDLDFLIEHKIDRIVNCSTTQTSLKIKKKLGRTNCLHFNVYDDGNEDLLRRFSKFNTFMKASKLKKQRVFVHCRMGISRSATFILSFLIHEFKWDCSQAYFHLKLKRELIEPNSGFAAQLNIWEFETQVKNNKILDVKKEWDLKMGKLKKLSIGFPNDEYKKHDFFIFSKEDDPRKISKRACAIHGYLKRKDSVKNVVQSFKNQLKLSSRKIHDDNVFVQNVDEGSRSMFTTSTNFNARMRRSLKANEYLNKH